jgi:hypothetical protein
MSFILMIMIKKYVSTLTPNGMTQLPHEVAYIDNYSIAIDITYI